MNGLETVTSLAFWEVALHGVSCLEICCKCLAWEPALSDVFDYITGQIYVAFSEFQSPSVLGICKRGQSTVHLLENENVENHNNSGLNGETMAM